ncbi:MAG: S8 family serine peptidase [Planctomycetaceae bacterium]|nr:S8 family serine peptidase [Planctomycetaceae bacterium]
MNTKHFQIKSRINHRIAFELLEDRFALSGATGAVVMDASLDSQTDTALLSSPDANNNTDNELETYAKVVGSGSDTAKQYSALTGLDDVRNLYGLDGSGQTVVVIDSGIAYNHIDLGGGFGSDYRVVGGYDFADQDDDPYDSGAYGLHGTHVAGIIASQSTIYPGVAQGVDLVALRIFGDDGTSDMQYLIDALRWVHDNKDVFANPVTTINLSVGFQDDSLGYYQEINQWFRVLHDDGIFISVAAGNAFESLSDQSQLSYPAVSEYVVAVGSCDTSGNLSYFSERNESIIVAPGQNVKSTVPDYAGNRNGIDDDYSMLSGTSMAAPYVAGASTLIRQAMQITGVTNITQDMIYQVMVTTADKVFDAVTGKYYSRLNVKNAIESILPKDSLGNTLFEATGIGTLVDSLNINSFFETKTDNDWFSFVATRSGTVTVTPSMSDGLAGSWNVASVPNAIVHQDGTVTFEAIAGQKYSLGFKATGTIGAYTISAKYATSENSSGTNENKTETNAGSDSKTNDNTGVGTTNDSDKTDNNTTESSSTGSNNSENNGNLSDANSHPNIENHSETDNNTDSNTDDNTGTTDDSNKTDNNTADSSNFGSTINTETDGENNRDTNPNDVADKIPVTVAQTTLEHQRWTNQGTWYALTAGNTGIMTIEIVLPSGVSANDVVMECGDAGGNVTTTHAGTTRLDLNITAGATVWVRISTASGKIVNDAAIRLTNLVRKEGSHVFVSGTDRNDDISFVAGATRTLLINGTTYLFDADTTSIDIDGRGGNDAIFLTGSSGTDYLTIDGTGGDSSNGATVSLTSDLSGDSCKVDVRNVESVTVNGSGGNNGFRYYDTAGDDQITVRPGEITVASEKFFAKVNGFSDFYAYSNRGGHDTASLYDSPDVDILNVSAACTQFWSGGTTSRFYSFASIIAYSGGGPDIATFTDTGLGDLFNGSYESIKRITPSTGQTVEARNFAQVDLTSVYGGQNSVQLEDSRGDDTLYVLGNDVTLVGERYGISVRGFDRVHASSVNGGRDNIMFYNTVSGKTLIAEKNTIGLIDSLHEYWADGFQEVWAFGPASESGKVSKTTTDYLLNLLGLWDDGF